jgi:lipoyl synthase
MGNGLAKTSDEILQIRVSVGTAIAIGLLEGKLDAAPTTAYLMTYTQGRCSANCGFCPQARASQSKTELLSRVSWPIFKSQAVIGQIANATRNGTIKRICIQALNYPKVFSDLSGFVLALKQQTAIPVSVSCQPLNSKNMWALAKSGVDRIGIALDAATEKVFDFVKGGAAGGPYKWNDEFTLLRTAIGVFGEGNVSTHLIFGLGETEKETVSLLQRCVDMGVLPGLFAFTPIRGTALAQRKQPALQAYRRIQLARYLIVNALSRFEDMEFTSAAELTGFGVATDMIAEIIQYGKPFITSGCPDCNRPFYNEKPSGPLYNFPRKPTAEEIAEIRLQLAPYVK